MEKYLRHRARLKLLQFFNWIPDKQMIQMQYQIKTGRKLNLNNPLRYTEKIQWYKLYYRDPLIARCSDKWEVRKYIEEKGLSNILNENYGVYDRAEEIPFNCLPEKFVIKATNGAGGIGIKIYDGQEKPNEKKLRTELTDWVKKQKNGGGREWAYYRQKPRILVEKYLEPGKNEGSLTDYKFFCFQGEPYCLFVINERFSADGLRFNILDLDYKVLPYIEKRLNRPIRKGLEKPENFEQMIAIARKLSRDFPHVRVDLYHIDGKIYFGELTFFSGSGYYEFVPDEFDFILGEKFILPH